MIGREYTRVWMWGMSKSVAYFMLTVNPFNYQW
jgi:hypothetical protein